MTFANINWGKTSAWTLVVFMLICSIGYAASKDYRRALYWFFAACVTVTVTV